MSRRDEQLWEDVSQEVIDYIKRKDNDRDLKGTLVGELRSKYYDAMSEDRWRSREFGDLVDTVVASLREVEDNYAREGDRKRDIIAQAAQLIVDGHFAVQVLDSNVARELKNEVYDALLDAKDEAIRIARRSSRGDRDDDRDRDRDGRNPYDDRRDRDRDRDRNRDRSSRRDTGTSGRRRETTDDGWDILSDIGDDDDDDRQREKDRKYQDEIREVDLRDDRSYAPEPLREEPVRQPRVTISTDVDGPDYSQASPFEDFIEGGERFRAAHLSDWQLTPDFDLDTPEQIRLSAIPTLYNINTHIKYYVMDAEGCVREEFEKVTDENRRLAHQLREDPRVEEVSRPRSARVTLTRDDSDLSQHREQRQAGQSLAKQLDEVDISELKFSATNMADSLPGIVFSGQMDMIDGGNKPRAGLYFRRSPLVIRGEGQLDLIDQVNDTTTLTAAADRMVELRDKFDKPIWETLNKRFAENVLRVSRYQFQFNGVAKFNFSSSFGRFLQAFREARGNEETSLFSRRIMHVIQASCAHMLVEDINFNADDLMKGRKADALMFTDFFAVISINSTLDDLGIGNVVSNEPTGVSIESTSNADLYKQFRRIFDKLEDEVPAQTRGRLLISTADNRLLEVHPYFGEHKAYILSAVEQ
jgi:hypothetical protein